VSLFVSGCTHHCKGCFNQETWSFSYGTAYTEDTQKEILAGLSRSYIRGLSLLGGEPFEPENQETVLGLVRAVRKQFPEKTVWCYSGYTLEQDMLSGRLGQTALELLRELDVLVDGEFVEQRKNPDLRFRGSENQRLIDVQKSLEAGETVLWDGRKEP
jgi:anaerobic ribonucleoside-triphosphate reductase activating protein